MPLFYQHNINENTKLAIWHISEQENFFLKSVPLLREITHQHKRLQHLAGRYLLQYLFADFPQHEILIADTRKPYLPGEEYHFSISHCGNYAAALVSKNFRTGIDIEIPTNRLLNISNKFLNDKEKSAFKLIEIKNIQNVETFLDTLQLLTVLWSAKEAVYKWWSYGKVDFKNHIQLQHFPLDFFGSMNAVFLSGHQHFELMPEYCRFKELCLTWIITEK